MVRIPDLIRMREQGEPIAMLTAYDYLFAKLADAAGADCILVGDSVATVVQGRETTLPVTLDEMIYHSAMVVRAVERAFVVADLPFLSYQLGPKEGLQAAGRLVKEAGVGAVKLEGGVREEETIREITSAGIPVMGHVGLQPQSVHTMGGYSVQGRGEDASRILADAEAVVRGGAFAIVLEGIPAALATEISDTLTIPTIGIGAGDGCHGQVLVGMDVLGLTDFGERAPRFVKAYGEGRALANNAFSSFVSEVKRGVFPDKKHQY